MLDSNCLDFVEVRSIQNDYELEQAAQLVGRILAQGECLTQSLNFSFDDIYNGFIVPRFPRFKNFLELQIVSVSNGEIVGAVLCEDLFDLFQPQLTEQSVAYDEIYQQQEEKFFTEQIIKPVAGYYFHIFFLVTDPSQRFKGLARRMIELAIEKAPLRGFKEAFIECSSPTSTYIVKKFGFQEIGKSKNGQNPYAYSEELYGCDADTFLLLKLQENKEKDEIHSQTDFQNQSNNLNTIKSLTQNKSIQLTK